jgi:hypothetical protein
VHGTYEVTIPHVRLLIVDRIDLGEAKLVILGVRFSFCLAVLPSDR